MKPIILNTKEFESYEHKVEYTMFGSCCVAGIALKKDDPRNLEIHKIRKDFQLLIHEPRFKHSKGSGWWLFSKCQIVGYGLEEIQRTQINYWNCRQLTLEESRNFLIDTLKDIPTDVLETFIEGSGQTKGPGKENG